MPVNQAPPRQRRWTARELLKLSAAERDAILEAAAAEAENEYRNNKDLAASEAFGAGDLYGDSANTETRRDLVD